MKVEEKVLIKLIHFVFFGGGGFETQPELQNNNLRFLNIHISKQLANLPLERVTADLIYVRA